jgi:hypothetical protein
MRAPQSLILISWLSSSSIFLGHAFTIRVNQASIRVVSIRNRFSTPAFVLQNIQSGDAGDIVNTDGSPPQLTTEVPPHDPSESLQTKRARLVACYSFKTIKTLKEILKERSLRQSGLKADLVHRLVEYDLLLQQQQQQHEWTNPVTSVSDEKDAIDSNQLFSLVKKKLYNKFEEQSEGPMAKRLAAEEILENLQIALYLSNDEKEFDQEGGGLSSWTGFANNVSIFEPGRLPLDFVMAAIDHFRERKLIHRWYIYSILKGCRELFCQLPSLVSISIPKSSPHHDPKAQPRITVCGDLHGQFYDLLQIFELNGYPDRNNPYVFNGDFVDRGAYSLEVITTLLMFKLYDPECICLIRGNHETAWVNSGKSWTLV